MKHIYTVTLLFFFTACSSPSPQYFGADADEQVISGMRFDVYQSNANAQAIRLGGRIVGGKSGIRVAAIMAIESATGCTVIQSSVEGGTEVINAALTCPNV